MLKQEHETPKQKKGEMLVVVCNYFHHKILQKLLTLQKKVIPANIIYLRSSKGKKKNMAARLKTITFPRV